MPAGANLLSIINRQPGHFFTKVGCFHEEPSLRIGLATWGGILSGARASLEFFRSLLDYSATPDEGVAWLRERYADHVPAASHLMLVE